MKQSSDHAPYPKTVRLILSNPDEADTWLTAPCEEAKRDRAPDNWLVKRRRERSVASDLEVVPDAAQRCCDLPAGLSVGQPAQKKVIRQRSNGGSGLVVLPSGLSREFDQSKEMCLQCLLTIKKAVLRRK